MGQLLATLAQEKGYTLTGQVSRVENIDWESVPADVVIDFSHASQVEAVVRGALRSGKALVTGTTGWENKQEPLSPGRRACYSPLALRQQLRLGYPPHGNPPSTP